jgi:hypothetical protein
MVASLPGGPGSGETGGDAQDVHRAQSSRSDYCARAAVERLTASTPKSVDRYLTRIYNKHLQKRRGPVGDEGACLPDSFCEPQATMTGG